MKIGFDQAQEFKVVFFGTPQFSVPSLIFLNKAGYNIKAVVTQPDKPQGRGRKFFSSPVKLQAQKLGLDILQPEKLNNIITKLTSFKADLFVVVAYGEFLPIELINLPKFKTVNIHPSLLPKYRGPSPIQWSLLKGDKITGNSLMLIDEEMDHGPILAQSQVTVDPDDNTKSLSKKLSVDAAQLITKILPRYLSGKMKAKQQDHTQASFSKLITKQDALVDWQDTEENILNKIRAYNPWPVVQINWGGKILKIYKAKISDGQITSGKIEVDKINNKIYLGTSGQALEILELQLPGKKMITAKEFINGLR